MNGIFMDLTGQIFTRLTVIELLGRGNSGIRYRCRCICGKEKIINGRDLKSGHTKSCGCYRVDVCKSNTGSNNNAWKGGKYTDSDGYVQLRLPDHPNAIGGYVAEHTYVMFGIIGRPLKRKETVHHKNGIRHDNSPDNLELWVSIHPKGQRVSDLVSWAKGILDEYGSIPIK